MKKPVKKEAPKKTPKAPIAPRNKRRGQSNG